MAGSKNYIFNHMGKSAIICGSAPCLLPEFNEAIGHLPKAKIFAVNDACRGLFADFLVSYHTEKMADFKSMSLNPDIITLTARGSRDEIEESFIDYRFSNIQTGATSVGDAIQIAKIMGFSKIVLVGAPMNGADGYFTKIAGYSSPFAFGSRVKANCKMLESYKAKLADISQMLDLSMVSSMSGYSAKIFGKVSWSRA